jgi:hypothetical protein
MITWKYQLWRSIGAAAALGLAACGGEGGENAGGERGGAAHGEAGEAAAPAASASGGEAGEAAIGEAGGEHGEAGVQQAFAGVEGDQRTALRLMQLRGFVLAATLLVDDATGDASSEAASLLIQQGLLEVYDPAADQFGALDVSALRQAANEPTATRARMLQYLQAGDRAIDVEILKLSVNGADVVTRLLDISTGLYQHVNAADGGVDPTEYQHSYGAALAARNATVYFEASMRRENLLAYMRALKEVNDYLELWPTPTAPEQPTPYRDVLAHSARIKLALSPFL